VCERDGETGFGSWSLVKSAFGALWLCLILHLPSVHRTGPTDGTAPALAQLRKQSVAVQTLGRLDRAKKVAANALEIGTLLHLVGSQ
jgi:hypothetical protein